MYIVFTNSISKGNKYFFPVHYATSKSYRMANTLAICLVNKMRGKLGIFLADIVLYLIAEITDNKNKLFDSRVIKLINNDTQNRFACQRDQSLRLRVSMRSQFRSRTCDRNDCLHSCVFEI